MTLIFAIGFGIDLVLLSPLRLLSLSKANTSTKTKMWSPNVEERERTTPYCPISIKRLTTIIDNTVV